MKALKIVVCFSACMLMFTSCLNDLNPKSLGSQAVTASVLYTTPASYLEGLAKLYASFILQGSINGDTDITTALTGGDGGATVYTRQLWNWQELSTDEAVIAWTGNADLQNIHQQNWTATGGYLTAMYTRVMYTITLCNEFIHESATSTDASVKQYHAEARFLRALAYWHALDLYGNPPFVTENSPIGSTPPPQITATKLYNYIQSELKAIESELGAPTFSYGHADQGALWMLQAKMYLNAPTYTGATNTYDSCILALNKIFASNKYSLAASYGMNFCADNNKSPEIIFPITEDGVYAQTYGGMDFVIHAALGGSMSPANFGVTATWGGTRTTSALVNKFADPSGATDVRAMFYTSGQNLEIADYTNFNDGYAITKFTNLTFAGGPSPSGAPDFVDTDVPMFRLADAYLMYAEAFLRGATTADAATATGYLNSVITRAYKGSTAHNSGMLTAGSANDLQFILDERARELYWEGHRRTDLIRFGQFGGGTYIWPWKGDVASGVATSSDGHLNIYPIPASDLAANPNLKQNPGYN